MSCFAQETDTGSGSSEDKAEYDSSEKTSRNTPRWIEGDERHGYYDEGPKSLSVSGSVSAVTERDSGSTLDELQAAEVGANINQNSRRNLKQGWLWRDEL